MRNGSIMKLDQKSKSQSQTKEKKRKGKHLVSAPCWFESADFSTSGASSSNIISV
jgi:hypothetical protein